MRESEERRRNILMLAIILIGASLYYFLIAQGSPSMRFSEQDRTFTFLGPKNTSAQFSFDALTMFALSDGENPDWGEALEGGEVLGGNLYGTFQSDSLGEYQAFVNRKNPVFIIAADSEKCAIFNSTSRETTVSLYHEMLAFKDGELRSESEYARG